MDQLFLWLNANNSFVNSKLYINKESPTLCISKPVKNEVLWTIDDACIIKTNDKYDTCMKLIHEMELKEESFFYPYINSLPKNNELLSLPFFNVYPKDVDTLCSTSQALSSGFTTLWFMALILYYDYILRSDVSDVYKTLDFSKYIVFLYYKYSIDSAFVPLYNLLSHSSKSEHNYCTINNNQATLDTVSLDFSNNLCLDMHGMNHSDIFLMYGAIDCITDNLNIIVSPFCKNLSLQRENRMINVIKENNFPSGSFTMTLNKNDKEEISPESPILIYHRILAYYHDDKNDVTKVINFTKCDMSIELKALKSVVSLLRATMIDDNKINVIKYDPLRVILENNNKIANQYINSLKKYWGDFFE